MGLFSSSKSSSSTTNITEVDTVSAEGGDNTTAVNVKGGDVSLTTTDFGALDTASDISERAFDFADTSQKAASDTFKEATEATKEIALAAAQDEAARTQQLLIVGIVVVAAIFVARPILKKVF